MKMKFTEYYSVDEKNKTVYCTLKFTNRAIAVDTVNKLRTVQRDNCDYYIKHKQCEPFAVPTIFRAKAKLAEGDNWSEQTGKKIAREKAYEKARRWNKKYIKHLDYMCMSIMSTSDGAIIK